jgi:pilus assembly protein Flp/PilA
MLPKNEIPYGHETVYVKGESKMKICKMKKWLSAFLKDEEGASAIEYALMALMVAVALIGLSGEITTKIKETFGKIRDAVTLAP